MFEFNGEWEFDLQLEEFKILNNSEYIDDVSNASQGFVKVEIFDEFNANPDPEEYQLNAIHYLLDKQNQARILYNLLIYSREIIYPHYKEFMWESEYPECYPKLNTIVDLNKLYGIYQISIKRIGHLDHAYYIFNCNSCLDYEHGITITLHKDEVIDHGENWEDKKVCEHKGIDYSTYSKQATKAYNHREAVLTEPHPKYGKLKPWQKNQNDRYPFELYRTNKMDEFIQAIDNGVFPSEPVTSRITELSIIHGKEPVTQLLLARKPKYAYAAFKEALKKDRFDITDMLLEQGYAINEQRAQRSHFYETIGFLSKAISNEENINVYKIRLKYLLANGLDPYLEDNFSRNALYRIDRINDKKLKEQVNNEVKKILVYNSTIMDKLIRFFKKKKP
ncbi:MAG: hypothetical protein P1U56_20825 [Saprospiraceae bacterium]|nr:hypothetical protein [Saprospiraceae bacterium]